MPASRISPRAFTLIELLVVVAIIALLVSILLPSLGRAKELATSIVCGNRHKGTYTGFTYYASDANGVWMAPWDRRHSWPGVAGSAIWVQQYPHTMTHYAAGSGIPNGEVVWDGLWAQRGYAGPWYDEDGRHGYPPSYSEVDEAVQMQCPTLTPRGLAVNRWHGTTSLSYFIMGGHKDDDNWIYDANDYALPDIMTHAATTGLMMCLSGILTEGQTNAWCTFSGFPLNPHMEKSNYLFSDGHAELLGLQSVNENMWRSRWER